MRSALQRLYSMFPNGLPGAGLLLLRLACGALVIASFVTRILGAPHIATLILQSIEVVGAVLLLIGLWTPVAGILVALVELCLAFLAFGARKVFVLTAGLRAKTQDH